MDTNATPSVFFITTGSTGIPATELSVEKDRVPSILLVLMILLLPCIAISVGVALCIGRRLRSGPGASDVEHKPNRMRVFQLKGSRSEDTLTTNTPIPTIRVISKSPSRDNESIDMDIEKLSYADFSPEATSTLPRRAKGGREALDNAKKDAKTASDPKDDNTVEVDIVDPAVLQALSSFRISSESSEESDLKETASGSATAADRHPSYRNF